MLGTTTTRTLAVLLLAAAFTPGPAAVAAPRTVVGAVRSIPPGFRQMVEQLPGGAEFLSEIEEARARQRACECDFAYPLSDVDDDGTTDVLYGIEVGTPRATRFQVLDGTTGEALFAAPVQVPGWGYAAAADLGAHGRGFVYFSRDYLHSAQTVTIGAVGRSGARLWERRWHAVPGYGPARAEHELHGVDLARGADGQTEILIATSASVTSYVGTPQTSAVVLERISAASGATIDAGSYRAEALDDVAVTALDAGGSRSDVLIQTSSFIASDILVELRSDLGSPRWSTRVASPNGFFIHPVEAHVAGDAEAEILLHVARPRRVQAFDRSTGRVVWSARETLDGVVPGDGGAKADVLVGTTTIGDGSVGYALSRKSIAGRSRWSTELRVLKQVHYSTWGFGSAALVGDATGDGARDVRTAVYLYEDEGDYLTVRKSAQYLVDGRTGAKVKGGPTYFPVRGSFTRSGTDAVEFRRRGARLEVAALDGATSRALWWSRLPVSPDSPPCSWSEHVLATEAGPDLLFLDLPTERGDKELVLDGASGEILWSL